MQAEAPERRLELGAADLPAAVRVVALVDKPQLLVPFVPPRLLRVCGVVRACEAYIYYISDQPSQ